MNEIYNIITILQYHYITVLNMNAINYPEGLNLEIIKELQCINVTGVK